MWDCLVQTWCLFDGYFVAVQHMQCLISILEEPNPFIMFSSITKTSPVLLWIGFCILLNIIGVLNALNAGLDEISNLFCVLSAFGSLNWWFIMTSIWIKCTPERWGGSKAFRHRNREFISFNWVIDWRRSQSTCYASVVRKSVKWPLVCVMFLFTLSSLT